MPLLALRFVYKNNIREPIELQHGTPKQPLRLVHYTVKLNAVDNNLSCIQIQVPWLNNFDVNSNMSPGDSIPVPVDPELEFTKGPIDVEFNISKSIDEVFDWKAYDQDGVLYESQDFEVLLHFNYRRADLM